VCVSICVIKFI